MSTSCVFLKHGRRRLGCQVYVGNLNSCGVGNGGCRERTCGCLAYGGEDSDCGDRSCDGMNDGEKLADVVCGWVKNCLQWWKEGSGLRKE
jgi:hypothetical protein